MKLSSSIDWFRTKVSDAISQFYADDIAQRCTEGYQDFCAAIEPGAWNRLAGDEPFLRHEFLHALHETGCASEATGWAPRYLAAFDDTEPERLVGAMPLYVKSHSRGEYVFDWAWADAYERHGLEYYPKLLSAIPFTPVTGPRLLAESDAVAQSLAARCTGERVGDFIPQPLRDFQRGPNQILRHVAFVRKIDSRLDERQRLDDLLAPGIGAIAE